MFSFHTSLSRNITALLAGLFVLSACTVVPPSDQAASSKAWKAGDMTVTVIQDLPFEMDASLFSGPATEAERLKYFTDGKAEASVNVFLLRMGDKIALFDAGAGPMIFQTPGKLREALANQGIKPEDIDFVLLTHMHGDHIGGLLQGEERAFPKAKLMVSGPEIDWWVAFAQSSPQNSNEFLAVNAALVLAVVAAYGDDIQPFAFGDSVLPGVTALDAAGHTPGHTVFQLTAGKETLFIIGDLLHAMNLQLALPDECAVFDMDPPAAILARKRILDLAAESNAHIAGMHFPLSNAIGAIEKDGEGWKFK